MTQINGPRLIGRLHWRRECIADPVCAWHLSPMTRTFRITFELQIEDVPKGDDAANVAELIAALIELESPYEDIGVTVANAYEVRPN